MTLNEFEVLKENICTTMPSQKGFPSPNIAVILFPTPIPPVQSSLSCSLNQD